jgi:hypothetical protein
LKEEEFEEGGFGFAMVLLRRLELPTSPLPRECSTTELQQRWRFSISKIVIMQG